MSSSSKIPRDSDPRVSRTTRVASLLGTQRSNRPKPLKGIQRINPLSHIINEIKQKERSEMPHPRSSGRPGELRRSAEPLGHGRRLLSLFHEVKQLLDSKKKPHGVPGRV
jgi:hypothetical protein